MLRRVSTLHRREAAPPTIPCHQEEGVPRPYRDPHEDRRRRPLYRPANENLSSLRYVFFFFFFLCGFGGALVDLL